MTDNVNHPAHYKTGIKCDHCDKEIECITITRNFNFALGNVIKYVWRANHKGEYAEQLRKARWYLNDEIDRADGLNFLKGCELLNEQLENSHEIPSIPLPSEPGVEIIKIGDKTLEIHQLSYDMRGISYGIKEDDKTIPSYTEKLKSRFNEVLNGESIDCLSPLECNAKLNQIKEYVGNIWYQYMAVSNPKERDTSLCVEAIQTLVEQFKDGIH